MKTNLGLDMRTNLLEGSQGNVRAQRALIRTLTKRVTALLLLIHIILSHYIKREIRAHFVQKAFEASELDEVESARREGESFRLYTGANLWNNII